MRISIFGICLLTACDVLWITPGTYETKMDNISDKDGDNYTVEQGDCDDENANINPWQPEIKNNGVDDDCDGIIDPGNGTAYFNFTAETEEDYLPYWEFYNARWNNEPIFPDDTFPIFLNPIDDWEYTFMFVRPSQQELTQDQFYFLFGRNDINFGYKQLDNSVLFFYQLEDNTGIHNLSFEVQSLNIGEKSVVSVVWEGRQLQGDADCNVNNLSALVLVDNQPMTGNYDYEIDGDLSVFCNYNELVTQDNIEPVTFGGRESMPDGFKQLGAIIDDLIMVEGHLSQTERQLVVDQIHAPPADFPSNIGAHARPNIDHTDASLEDDRRFMWQTVDVFNGDCTVGFLDFHAGSDGYANASWRNYCDAGTMRLNPYR